MLSHELRQPLTSVSGLVKLIGSNKSLSETERGELLQMLEQSVVNLDEAVRVLVKKATRQI
jgi:signal transduction histidine kinase